MNRSDANTEFEEDFEIQPSIVKAQQIQSTTHLEILALGNKVYKKATFEQQRYLEEQLLKHERKIRFEMQKEHEENIKRLTEEHEINIRRLKEEFVDMQNTALQEEASRVEAVMNEMASQMVAETALEGQSKLHQALIKTREKFDLEKKKAIEETIKVQELLTKEKLKEIQGLHLKDLQLLNDKWTKVKEDLESDHSLKLQNMLSKQKEELQSEYECQLRTALQSAQDKHMEEMNQLHSSIELVNQDKERLHVEIETLEDKLVVMNGNVKKILQSFREFIESSAGFSEGQSDYLLDNLIPAGLEEFIKTK